MTRGHPGRLPRPADPPGRPGRARRALRGGLRRRAVRRRRGRARPATKHVLGSNYARVHVRYEPRPGGSSRSASIDNLVKGAAGQAIQAFNLVHRPARDRRPRAAPAGAMTTTTDDRPTRTADRPSLTRGAARRSPARPPADRRASGGDPGRLRAGGATAGIKASGRPDLAVVADDRRPGRRGRGLHAERLRGRPGPPVQGPPGRRQRPAGRRLRLGRGDRLHERVAPTPRRARPATPIRPTSPGARRGRWARPPSGPCSSRPGSSGPGCPSIGSGPG